MRCSPPSAVSTSLATQGKREGVGNGGQSGVSYSPAIGNLGANKHRIWGGGGEAGGLGGGGGGVAGCARMTSCLSTMSNSNHICTSLLKVAINKVYSQL